MSNGAALDSGTQPLARAPGRPLPFGGLALGLLLPLVFSAGLELGVWAGWIEGRLTPPPSKILATLGELLATGEWFRHAAATSARVGAGFLFGASSGIALGAMSGASPFVRKLIDPMLQAFRAVPSIAWVPLFILWFGIFETSKITLISVGVFFPVYLGVLGAVLSVDRKVIEVGRVFRLSRFALARRIMLPATLPAMVTSLRAGLGLGWMFVVAAEIMGASEGLGFLLVDGQQVGRPDLIVSAIISFAVLGFLTDIALDYATRPLLRWRDDLSTTEIR
ncbi:TauC ABC-type nitrate/sulfonate/bicarbonate transport system, permease component [Rhabdaerophilaceae bacterium]